MAANNDIEDQAKQAVYDKTDKTFKSIIQAEAERKEPMVFAKALFRKPSSAGEAEATIQHIKPFAPRAGLAHITRAQLEGSFDDDMEVLLDLSKAGSDRFTPQGERARDLAAILNNSLNILKALVANDTTLSAYLPYMLEREENRGPPIIIKVSKQLPINAVRYYNGEKEQVEIILNHDFIDSLLVHSFKYPATLYLLAERLFHELGHDNIQGEPLQEAKEEAHLIEKDVELHVLINRAAQAGINRFFTEVKPEFPSGYYFRRLTEWSTLTQPNRQSKIFEYLRQNIEFKLATLSDEEIESKSSKELAEIIDMLIPMGSFNIPHKLLLFSAAPASGKGEVMALTFEPHKGRYEHLVDKFILYHTRDPRKDKNDRSEKDGVAYHFRTEDELIELERQGKIITARVNDQLQGMAIEDFWEDLTIPAEELNPDKRGIILDSDHIVEEADGSIKLKRQVQGMGGVFRGEKLVVLEGGRSWFNALKKDTRHKKRYENVLAQFISLFSDDELEIRAKNNAWVDSTFQHPEEKALAYSKIYELLKNRAALVDITGEEATQEEIIKSVRDDSHDLILTVAAHNAEIIDSPRFLKDLRMKIEDLGAIDKVKAIAYEINRRISSREGETTFSFSKATSAEGYDRYQRVLEGIRQVLTKDDYDVCILNLWGWTEELKYANIESAAENFAKTYFVHVIKGLRDAAISDIKGFAAPKASSAGAIDDIGNVNNIAFITAESTPIIKTGGLGDVSEELVKELARSGKNVTVFLPKWDGVEGKPTGLFVDVDIVDQDTKEDVTVSLQIYEAKIGNVTAYTLADPDYIRGIYDGDELNFAVLLAEGSLKAIEQLVKAGLMAKPEVLHCNDWMTSLVPVYLRTKYQHDHFFKNMASIFTIHSLAHQGGEKDEEGNKRKGFAYERFREVHIDDEHWFGLQQPDDHELFNIMHGAIYHADKIVPVSENYAKEILGHEYGAGLDGILRVRHGDIVGITNGVDPEKWMTYGTKSEAKERAQREYGLDIDPEIPMIFIYARIAAQKGVMEAIHVIERILEETNGGIQFVYGGKGNEDDPYYWEGKAALEALAADPRWQGKIKFVHGCNNDQAKYFDLACDIYLMPSVFEPCGTKQQVAITKGAIVVARRTGGLVNTVQEYNYETEEGWGFLFNDLDEGEFYDVVSEALALYWNKPEWERIVQNAFDVDRAWTKPARRYAEVFNQAHVTKHLMLHIPYSQRDKFAYMAHNYFNSDSARTLRALLNWQAGFKERLGRDISIEQLLNIKTSEDQENATEYFRILNEDGSATGMIKPRDLVHRDGDWHASVYIMVFDSEGRLILQRRPDDRQTDPGKLDGAVSGHVGLDADYKLAACREAQEELGLTLDPKDLIQIGRENQYKDIFDQRDKDGHPIQNRGLTTLYVYTLPEGVTVDDLNVNPNEVESLEVRPLNEELDRHAARPDDYATVGIFLEKNSEVANEMRDAVNLDLMAKNYFNGDKEAAIERLKEWQIEYDLALTNGKLDAAKVGVEKMTIPRLLNIKREDGQEDATEYFRLINESGSYTGEILPRDLCHLAEENKRWHRSVFVFVVDDKGRVLIQTRALNKAHAPGARDLSLGGHMGLDDDPNRLLEETTEESALRELEEELLNKTQGKERLTGYRALTGGLERINKIDGLRHRYYYDDAPIGWDNELVTVFVYTATPEDVARIEEVKAAIVGEKADAGAVAGEVGDMEWADIDDEYQRFSAAPDAGAYAAGYTNVFKNYSAQKDTPGTVTNNLIRAIEEAKSSSAGTLDREVFEELNITPSFRVKALTQDLAAGVAEFGRLAEADGIVYSLEIKDVPDAGQVIGVTLHPKWLDPTAVDKELLNIASTATHQRAQEGTLHLYHLIEELNPAIISFHIGFSAEVVVIDEFNNASPAQGFDTLSQDDTLSRYLRGIDLMIRGLRDRGYEGDILIENIDYSDTGAYEHVCEPEFIRSAYDQSEAGILLDFAHLIVSAKNLGYDPMDYLETILDKNNIEQLRELHIAVPEHRDDLGRWHDAHNAFSQDQSSEANVLVRELFSYVLALRRAYETETPLVVNFETDPSLAKDELVALDEFLRAQKDRAVAEKDVDTIVDWTSERETIPDDYDLLWVMGSRFTRVAEEAARQWHRNNTPILVTGGVGRETTTISELLSSNTIDDDALGHLDAIFDGLGEILADYEYKIFLSVIEGKFGIVSGRDAQKLEDPERDIERKTWRQFYQYNLSEPELKRIDDGDITIEEVVISRLIDRGTRYNTFLPEGILYYAILLSMDVDYRSIHVDAQSTTSVENIIYGAEILNYTTFDASKILLFQEPYIQRRGRATLTKHLPAHSMRWSSEAGEVISYAPYLYKDEKPIALRDDKELDAMAKLAKGEVRRFLEYPHPPREAITTEPIPIDVLKAYERLLRRDLEMSKRPENVAISAYRARSESDRGTQLLPGVEFDSENQIADAKIDGSGNLLPFHGLTAVTRVASNSHVAKRISAIQREMMEDLTAEGMGDSIRLLDKDSFHMTIADIDPSDKFECAKTGVSEEQLRMRVDQASKAFEEIGAPGEISCVLKGVGLKRTISILVEFSDERELQKVLSIEDAIKRHADVSAREFVGKIGLAYLVKEPHDYERFKQILTKYANLIVAELRFGSIELAHFSDMESYTPVLTKDLVLGAVTSNVDEALEVVKATQPKPSSAGGISARIDELRSDKSFERSIENIAVLEQAAIDAISDETVTAPIREVFIEVLNDTDTAAQDYELVRMMAAYALRIFADGNVMRSLMDVVAAEDAQSRVADARLPRDIQGLSLRRVRSFSANHLLASALLNYAPEGQIAVQKQNQAIIVYSDILKESRALQAIIRSSSSDSRRFYLVNKEGLPAQEFLEGIGLSTDLFDEHVFDTAGRTPLDIMRAITGKLRQQEIRQARVFASSEDDLKVWNRQKLVDVLLVLLSENRFEIISDLSDQHESYIRQHEQILSQA
ncbi:DUF692 family multinuclear iron-containing protein [Candidatus Omnitrophota bacterium]